MRGAINHNRSRVSEAMSGLLQNSPERRVRDMCLTYETLSARLRHAWTDRVARAEHRLALAVRTLNTVSPLATLERGFAIVTRGTDGSLVTDAASLQVGDEIHTRVARGSLRAKVTGKDTGSEEQ
jgi:exodeoxyribonuclease VII large subunit